MGDTSQGTVPPEGTVPSEGGAPALSEDRIAQIAAEVVNRAFSARSKTLKKEIVDEFGQRFEKFGQTLDEKLAALAPKRDKKGKFEGGDPPSEEESPLTAGMKRQLAELQAEMEKTRGERDAERARSRDISMRTRIAEELAKHGIDDPRRNKLATGFLVDSEKRISHDEESGEFLYRDTDNTTLDLATGIKSWVKSEDGKYFLPPIGARGSGERPGQGGRPPPANTEPTFTDLGLAIAREFGGVPVG